MDGGDVRPERFREHFEDYRGLYSIVMGVRIYVQSRM